MEVTQNIHLFAELIQCGGSLYTWCYDAAGTLLYSNCPEEAFLASAFDLFGCKKAMLSYAEHGHSPLSLGTAIGVIWAAAFERENDTLKRIWVIGPAFYRDVSLKGIKNGLEYYDRLDTSVAWNLHLYDVLKQIPVLQNTLLDRYTLMLHYCVSGEHLLQSDIRSEAAITLREGTPQAGRDRYRVWQSEQGLLEMVRNGDLNYRQALSASSSISSGVPLKSDDALRQGKTSVIVFTSLVCRAAIEGGLSAEEAYALGDNYIQTAEQAQSVSDLGALAHMMYEDFIQRVHDKKINPALSRPIRKCTEYIDAHPEQKINAASLSLLTGYTTYYLTQKFKEETGCSVNDYIKQSKINRARVLLKNTDKTIREIAQDLGFSSRNYFSRVFQEVTGQTPVEFRS